MSEQDLCVQTRGCCFGKTLLITGRISFTHHSFTLHTESGMTGQRSHGVRATAGNAAKREPPTRDVWTVHGSVLRAHLDMLQFSAHHRRLHFFSTHSIVARLKLVELFLM